jgi:hypothetical protein
MTHEIRVYLYDDWVPQKFGGRFWSNAFLIAKERECETSKVSFMADSHLAL